MTAGSTGPIFDHLIRMTDQNGTFEHARFAEPRPEHGYCTDDMARVLVVAARQPQPSSDVNRLAIRFDSFTEEFSNILQRQVH